MHIEMRLEAEPNAICSLRGRHCPASNAEQVSLHFLKLQIQSANGMSSRTRDGRMLHAEVLVERHFRPDGNGLEVGNEATVNFGGKCS